MVTTCFEGGRVTGAQIAAHGNVEDIDPEGLNVSLRRIAHSLNESVELLRECCDCEHCSSEDGGKWSQDGQEAAASTADGDTANNADDKKHGRDNEADETNQQVSDGVACR